ncbi:MAG: hypothetical protein ABSG57_04620 [Candidatus Bathyarchaeia archaeon]
MKGMYGWLEILVEKILRVAVERAATLFADAGFSVVAFDVQRGIVARAEETLGIQ